MEPVSSGFGGSLHRHMPERARCSLHERALGIAEPLRPGEVHPSARGGSQPGGTGERRADTGPRRQRNGSRSRRPSSRSRLRPKRRRVAGARGPGASGSRPASRRDSPPRARAAVQVPVGGPAGALAPALRGAPSHRPSRGRAGPDRAGDGRETRPHISGGCCCAAKPRPSPPGRSPLRAGSRPTGRSRSAGKRRTTSSSGWPPSAGVGSLWRFRISSRRPRWVARPKRPVPGRGKTSGASGRSD